LIPLRHFDVDVNWELLGFVGKFVCSDCSSGFGNILCENKEGIII